jgi:hypothetical protein
MCPDLLTLQTQGRKRQTLDLGRGLVVSEAVLDEDLDKVTEVGQRRFVGRSAGPAVREFRATGRPALAVTDDVN